MDIIYRFTLNTHQIFEHKIEIDQDGVLVETDLIDDLLPWTLLENHQCTNCPLVKENHPYCPPARHMAPVLDAFKEVKSYDDLPVEVIVDQRISHGEVSAQVGLQSIMGLIMATSGCPIVGKFRPMARFHLPLSNTLETLYRAISMYLTAQVLRQEQGLEPNWDLSGLSQIYEDIREVNKGFLERIRAASVEDAGLNSLLRLDVFAQFGIDELNYINKSLRPVFSEYLKG